METFQVIWFILWGVLWGVYFMLDGFVFGTGMLHTFLGKTDEERRALINSVGPVWDGNEVWLLTAGGATFAAFPATYAAMFSYLYTALLLLLFALIIRGVSFEFRGKLTHGGWRRGWDRAIFVSSLIPSLLFGVAFGNIFRGLPMDAAGYHGSLIALLNPYGLLTGIFFVLLFLVHGALYVSVKTDGDLSWRGGNTAKQIWPALAAVAVAFLAFTPLDTNLLDNYLKMPALLVFPVLAVGGVAATGIFCYGRCYGSAFASSCVTIIMTTFTGVAGLFPNLIPSRIDSAWSLTAFNSSSSLYTLQIMTIVAAIFVPIVIGYKIWVYRMFRAPVTLEEVRNEVHPY